MTYIPKTTIENKELGITYVYTPMSEQGKLQLKKDRLKTFKKLLNWFEVNKHKLIPKIYERNVKWCREEINKLTK